MLGKGVKRKYHELEEAKEIGFATMYSEQRQSFLNISLFKLQSCRDVKEPKLLRSVLICNTLKQIHKELQMENTGKICGSMVLASPYIAQSDHHAEEIPTEEESQRAFSKRGVATDNKVKPQGGNKENVCVENASTRRSGTALAVNSRKDTCQSENTVSAMETEEEPLCPATDEADENSNVQDSCRTESDAKTLKNSRETDLSNFMVEFDSITDSTLSLLEACEEEFSDIDVSLYDFDLFTPLSPKSTEDIWKVSSSTSDNTSFSNHCPNNCRSDLMDDIDQIMNVLIEVGM